MHPQLPRISTLQPFKIVVLKQSTIINEITLSANEVTLSVNEVILSKFVMM